MIIAKKSLGQNFLTDRNILEKIVNIVDIKNKIILEVGPGTGNLTSFILKKKPKKIFVIEKDDNLAKNLNENFGEQLTIINDDILNIDENSLFDEKVIVFGNLPYNISTEILSKWIINLEDDSWFDCLVLMFQKEVANRIIAKVNSTNYGRLSIISNWRLNVEKVMDISSSCFYPKPKVESTLLKFTPKAKYFSINYSKNLEMITRIFFSERRKKIKNPFKKIFKNYIDVSEKLKVDLNLRPQNLSPHTYYEITKEYENLRS